MRPRPASAARPGARAAAARVVAGVALAAACLTTPSVTAPCVAVTARAQAPREGGIPVYRRGAVVDRVDRDEARARGLLVVDLGEAWVPSLFRAGPGPDGRERVNAYAADFVRLARGEEGEGAQYERARLDRHLELYGIPPTLGVLRERFRALALSGCVPTIDMAGLRDFGGSAVGEDDPEAREARLAHLLEPVVLALAARRGLHRTAELPVTDLRVRDRRMLDAWERSSRWQRGIDALRDRLACEGYLRGRLPVGADYDRRTRAAVAAFERRHRIYARGSLAGETLTALRTGPLELERLAVVRVVSERAMLEAGFVEDGSARLPDGQLPTHPLQGGGRMGVRDLFREMAERVESAFGLATPEQTLEWLHTLALAPDGHAYVAFEAPPPPEYHQADLELFVEIDRGDVWYDFPARGRPQPIDRYPTLTLYTTWLGERVPLVRYGTTIGGWRLERERDAIVWRYKESPVGPRLWREVVSAPVWIPPASTPDSELVTQVRRDDDGSLQVEVKTNLVGPGYASAYGLVAAYHVRPGPRGDTDEGIRTHGSVDYTSIWRRASHGCHRLHNHLAMRLFSFVIAHRAHERHGHHSARYERQVEAEGFRGTLRVDRGGYVFRLRSPIRVEVLPGRVRGRLRRASREVIPADAQDLDDPGS